MMMKYTSLDAFHKHLQSAAPHLLSKIYLCLVKDPYEREVIFQKIFSYFPSKPIRFQAGEVEIKEFLNAIHSMGLFDPPLVLLDSVEKLKKQEVEVISVNLQNLASTLILGGSQKTSLSDLVEKEGVILDLLGEKAWEREKRIQDHLMAMAKKKLSQES